MTRVWLFDPRGPSRSCPPAWMRSPRFGVRAVAAGGRRRDGVLNSVPFDWLRRECPCRSLWSTPADLAELLPLMRAYCDFYQVAPGDQALLELSQALLADPQREGVQLLARDDTGRVVGFATLFWTWQTLAATRVGVMNDLYVAAEARGTGVADGLIAACLERCRGARRDPAHLADGGRQPPCAGRL
jgi:hypothetical protein